MESGDSRYEPMAGSCECGDEPSGCGTTELFADHRRKSYKSECNTSHSENI